MSKADQIREAREQAGMTQEALAERLGVSRQAVSKWEMGNAEPSLENLRALTEILGVEFTGEESPANAKNPWKPLSLFLGCLLLAALIALGAVLRPRDTPPGLETEDGLPSITSIAFFAPDGTPLRPDLGDGWLCFAPDTQVLMAVSFQDSEAAPVFAVSAFITPTGTETFNQRQQLAVQSVDSARSISLLPLDMSLEIMSMGHVDVMLECGGGKTVTETLNITTMS